MFVVSVFVMTITIIFIPNGIGLHKVISERNYVRGRIVHYPGGYYTQLHYVHECTAVGFGIGMGGNSSLRIDERR